jgi:RHS repeat-associated protein
VTGAGGNSYGYDSNGNQITRMIGAEPFNLKYNAENQLVEVKKNSVVMATFVYDGDGRQVKATVNGVTTLYVGGHYEIKGNEISKYYFAGAARIAMRRYVIPQSMTLEYLLSDHLGSTSITTDAAGLKTSELRYKPWGEMRYSWIKPDLNTTPAYELTKYTFTGQRSEVDTFGLMFYNARWYDSATGRFAQADSIVPGGVQGLDRYAAMANNPVRFTDPTGHRCSPEDECDTPHGDKIVDNPLTENGKKMVALYNQWTVAFGYLSVKEFFGWMMYFEMNGLQSNRFLFAGKITTVLQMMKEVVARQLWGDASRSPYGGHGPYCNSGNCTNGLFNFLGEYAQVARDRLDDETLPQSTNYPTGFQTTNLGGETEYLHNELLQSANDFANSVLLNVKPEWQEYNNQLPYHWGNPEWAKSFSGPVGVTDINGVVYKNSSFVIFTQNQGSCQAGIIC